MRFLIACLMAAGLAAGPTAVAATAAADSGSMAAQQVPSGELDVDIDTGGGGAWYMSPIWIGIGVVALIALIALIVAAGRGSGTTIVKD